MAQRPIWRGYLQLSLVTCPVVSMSKIFGGKPLEIDHAM